MKTITIEKTIYNFDELSDSAKTTAINEHISDCGYASSYDWENVLNEFCKMFGIAVNNWEISTYYGYRYNIDTYNTGYIADCGGNRLAKYLVNNDSYYYRFDNKYHDIKFIAENCGLSGFCGDYDALRPVVDARDYKVKFDSFDDLMTECVEAIFSGWLRDMEYEETEEYFSEVAEINGYQFDEFGGLVSETVPF